MKQTTTQKKEVLINFITQKLKHSGENEEEIKQKLNQIKKLSYNNLRRWAIINDFIDY